MRVRYEPFGAWVKLESMHAVVAIDRDGVRALGLDGREIWRDEQAPSAPIEVHLAVTSRCGAGCEGCYLDAKPDGHERTQAELLSSLDAIADAGAFTVALGGGEPTLRPDLDELARACRERGLTPVLTTAGHGLTRGKIERLKPFAQVNVSYDGGAEAYQEVRGYDGAGSAEQAIRDLVAAGIRVGVNVVLTRASFPKLEETIARARALGAKEAQLLRYKPSGRAASLDYLSKRLTREQAAEIGPTLRRLTDAHSLDGGFSFRIDCAMVPYLSADATLYENPQLLQRWGVMGCEAAGALLAVKADGRVSPCSFAGSGGVLGGNIGAFMETDAVIQAWRAHKTALPSEPCASCNLQSICRGGCQIVSMHHGESFAPDPECPRVVADAKRET